LYTTTTIAISHTRKSILDTLSNFAFIPNNLQIADNEIFNELLLRKYSEYIAEFEYDKFIELRTQQEAIKKEIHLRIEKIKSDPKNRLIYKLCAQLAGVEMDIDNFIEFIDIITLHQDSLKRATSHTLADNLLPRKPAQMN
jgi:hypothetical protein